MTTYENARRDRRSADPLRDQGRGARAGDRADAAAVAFSATEGKTPGLTLDAGALIVVENRGTSDVIAASVVLCARANRHQVLTSDPRDLSRLDPNLDLIVV